MRQAPAQRSGRTRRCAPRTRPLLIPALMLPVVLTLPTRVLVAQSVEGRVLDATSGVGVTGVAIALIGRDGRDTSMSTTDADGAFRVASRTPGSFVLLVRRIGMVPATTPSFTLGPGAVRRATLRVEAVGKALDTVRVTTRGLLLPTWWEGFQQRRRSTGGIFLTRSNVANRRPVDPTDWFAGVRGVLVTMVDGRVSVISVSQSRCVLDIYLDNNPVDAGDLNRVVRGSDIAAVEVYATSNDAPGRYRQAGCGLALMWTRDGSEDEEALDGTRPP